jgi:hypothetical protein
MDKPRRHSLVFDADQVIAIKQHRKTQVRVPINRRNTSQNGTSWNVGFWNRARWGEAFSDPGPSPAGNIGPYLHVSAPFHGDMLGARVYPRFQVGDLIMVQEDWSTHDGLDGCNAARIATLCQEAGYRETWAPVQFEADGGRRNWSEEVSPGQIRPARSMPHWAVRLAPRITEIRLERLRSISIEDIQAEVTPMIDPPLSGQAASEQELADFGSLLGFMDHWERSHAQDAHKWAANPWVIVLHFKL